jgi:hypothetical protein
MTLLNIGSVTSDRKPLAFAAKAPCPQCGAKADQRVKDEGFGGHVAILCGSCGYEFKESE